MQDNYIYFSALKKKQQQHKTAATNLKEEERFSYHGEEIIEVGLCFVRSISENYSRLIPEHVKIFQLQEALRKVCLHCFSTKGERVCVGAYINGEEIWHFG